MDWPQIAIFSPERSMPVNTDRPWSRRLATIIAIVSALASIQFSLFGSSALGQVAEQSATYVSEVDKDLTLIRVTVLPANDNVNGIYAKPIEDFLIQLTQANHRWNYVEANMTGPFPTTSEIEEDPENVLKLSKYLDADAFIATAITRGPQGISVRLNLFSKKDGKLLAQEILRNHPHFELPEVKAQIKELYKRLLRKLPYDGLVLSRTQNRVTINMGKNDGLTKDQILSVIQIISVARHPKFNFVLSTEKEILGQIKLLKVEDTLSFGAIISEKERGAITKHAKISGLTPINYPIPDELEGEGGATLGDRSDSLVSFGKTPLEWIPVRPPSFGQVSLKIGLGSYTTNTKLDSIGSLEAKDSTYPSLGLRGEIWLTPNWTVMADLEQAVIATNNPRTGSTPGTLNHSMSAQGLDVAYNFLLHDNFFGPKLRFSLGVSSYRIFVDDTSPQAFTTASYSGIRVGLAGSMPILDDKQWTLGGRLFLFPQSSLRETPVSSGSSSQTSINLFSMFVEKKLAENLQGLISLDFALYSATFSGAGTRSGPSGAEAATSLSQRHSQISAGLQYQF